MTVRKAEPMNNVAARDDEFDALLDASRPTARARPHP
jgi:hypothetical protein